jgi:hypothetical protein
MDDQKRRRSILFLGQANFRLRKNQKTAIFNVRSKPKAQGLSKLNGNPPPGICQCKIETRSRKKIKKRAER